MTNYNHTLTSGGVTADSYPVASVGIHLALTSGGVGHTTLTPLLTAMLNDAVRVTTPLGIKVGAHNALHDSVSAASAMHVFWTNTLNDQAVAAGSVALTVQQIAMLIDTAIASGECASVLDARNAIVEMVFALTSLNRDWPESPSDAIAVADELQSQLVTAVLLVDQALAEDAIEGVVAMTMVISDSVDVSDPLTHILAAHEHVVDRVLAVLTFQIDGDAYTGVALNTQTTAVSEYQQFPFNSLAEVGGKFYGCAADGIYLLEGPDDDGEPINSSIRTGLIRVADGKRARVPTAYFGYTSTGDLVMKVVTTQVDGMKREDWYKLEARHGAASHSTRVKIGRGLSSVYWSFELHSISGATFGLDSIQLLPMILERRI